MTNPLAKEIVDDWVIRPHSLAEAVHSSEGRTRWRNDEGDFFGPMYVAELQIPSNREQLEQAQLIRAGLEHLSTLQSSDRTTEFLQRHVAALSPYLKSICSGDQDGFKAHASNADKALRAIRQRFTFGPAQSGQPPNSASRVVKQKAGRKAFIEPRKDDILAMYERMPKVSVKEIVAAFDLQPLGERDAETRVKTVLNTERQRKSRAKKT